MKMLQRNETAAAPHTLPADPTVLHPAAAKAAAQWSDMYEQLDRARAQVEHLSKELEIERRANAELKHQVDHEQKLKERFQRYAVAIQTHLAHLEHAAKEAHEQAQDMAMQEITQAGIAQGNQDGPTFKVAAPPRATSAIVQRGEYPQRQSPQS